MIAVEDSALVLLAAGRSVRFGDGGSKLDADLNGRALGLHVVEALADLPFRSRIAVTGRAGVDYAAHGFRVVANPEPEAGMGRSIGLGVALAGEAAAVVVVLADMPRVTAGHVRHLFEAAEGRDTVVASSDGTAASPPALFGADWFGRLLALDGEAGARALIRGATRVIAPAGELVDVDTPEALAALNRRPVR